MLGAKVQKLRKEKGYTLVVLASLSKTSKSYIWELENKDTLRPSAEKLVRIAAALGVTAEYLMDETTTVKAEDAVDKAFYQKYCDLDPITKAKIRHLVEFWSTIDRR